MINSLHVKQHSTSINNHDQKQSWGWTLSWQWRLLSCCLPISVFESLFNHIYASCSCALRQHTGLRSVVVLFKARACSRFRCCSQVVTLHAVPGTQQSERAAAKSCVRAANSVSRSATRHCHWCKYSSSTTLYYTTILLLNKHLGILLLKYRYYYLNYP